MENNNQFQFTKENYKLLIIGLASVVIGFFLMAGGKSDDPAVFTGDELFSFRRITLAPIMVLAGLGVVMFSIMKKPKE